MNEFETLAASSLKEASFGSFLVIPLKWTDTMPHLEELGKPLPVTTMDLTEPVKKMFNRQDEYRLLNRYYMGKDLIQSRLVPASEHSGLKTLAVNSTEAGANGFHQLSDADGPADGARYFTLESAWLYVYRTHVAFLCLEIHYDDICIMQDISNLGYSDISSCYYACYEDGTWVPFAFDNQIDGLCRSLGFESFAAAGVSPLMEAFLYHVSVSPKRFRKLKTARQICFNQHLMDRFDTALKDRSEEDIHYVYSVKDQALGSYRWGCCVTSQTISYAVGRSDNDLDDEMHQQAEDGLPLVTLALYQKYTSLIFSEQLSILEKRNLKRLGELKRSMMEFKAFEVIEPAMLTRWYNVRMIYQHLLDYNGVSKAIDSIDGKISMLAEHQASIRAQRSNTLMGLITIFGLVSILASVLQIINLLEDGGSIFWQVSFASMIVMAVIAVLVLINNRKAMHL